jgi:23S rRNA (pseudouridine1915-N3)-methyltransferase
MKVSLLMVGKTDFDFIEKGISLYQERIKKYIPFEISFFKTPKKLQSITIEQIKKQEGIELMKKLQPSDFVILLDERGKELNSVGFASLIENKMGTGTKKLVFVIGGAYGFSAELYKRANEKISLSKMTFSHQLVRLIFMEQFYRAFTIIRGEPYHHE